MYVILGILGLGLLVFLHELGHYFVAMREGMRVEAFAIGFGKPIFTWERKGVKWHICMLPFGGYVKIAGMQKEGGKEPHEIADGFFGKSPWSRIKVAFAGPLVNILIAVLLFSVLWMTGGREKDFSEFTHHVGFVDPHSPLYQKGIRPGDVVEKYDGKRVSGFKDLLLASLMEGETFSIQGYSWDPLSETKRNFSYTLPSSGDGRVSLLPAQYLLYDGKRPPSTAEELQLQDRLLWADGEVIFSAKHLSSLINTSSAFLTIERDGESLQTKVPRIQIDELKMNSLEKAELDDWRYEASLGGKLQDLYFIPCILSPEGIVEKRLSFLDPQDQERAFSTCERCQYFHPLQEGDRIVAIDGVRVKNAYELLSRLQERRVLTIFDRTPLSSLSWKEADMALENLDRTHLEKLVASIGTENPLLQEGNLHLLSPISPKPLTELPLTEKEKGRWEKMFVEAKNKIEQEVDPVQKREALEQLEMEKKKLLLGISFQDREVIYNPTPLEQLQNVLQDTWRTLSGLFSGMLHPKYMAGPVGIVHAVHNSWMVGTKEALFWMAVISFNLAIMNLLPIPILDGGHMLFAAIELVTKKPLRSKTVEKLVPIFVGLLISFFVYITYQDIARLFSKIF